MDLQNFATFRVAAVDLNGQMRGKRLPASYFATLDSGAVRMPLSVLPRIFAPKLIRNLVATKRQEIVVMGAVPEDQHWKTYLEKV